MRRADDDRLDVRSGKRIDADPSSSTGTGTSSNACEAGGDTPGLVAFQGLRRQPGLRQGRQARKRKVEALGEPRAHHDAFGISSRAHPDSVIARQHLS